MPEQDRTPSSSHSLTTLRCRCCAARLTKPKQLFEVEVEVTLDRPDRAGLVDPLQRAAYRQPRILLNMSSTRTLSLLGLSSEALASGPQINPKEILYKRLENVVGLVIRIEKNLEINDPNSVGRILVVEVPAD
ncbi:unnamed protein product [Calicophoron daubneyi]|uniref:Uncharacterized protein n=1 Tax=Calicophoron daubneyi TaxID=300641 RepID=A0AAV2TIS2_CALDB